MGTAATELLERLRDAHRDIIAHDGHEPLDPLQHRETAAAAWDGA